MKDHEDEDTSIVFFCIFFASFLSLTIGQVEEGPAFLVSTTTLVSSELGAASMPLVSVRLLEKPVYKISVCKETS